MISRSKDADQGEVELQKYTSDRYPVYTLTDPSKWTLQWPSFALPIPIVSRMLDKLLKGMWGDHFSCWYDMEPSELYGTLDTSKNLTPVSFLYLGCEEALEIHSERIHVAELRSLL
jgi:hypothetical protein